MQKTVNGLSSDCILFSVLKIATHATDLFLFFSAHVFRPKSERQRLKWGEKQRSCSRHGVTLSAGRNLQASVASAAAAAAAAQPLSQTHWLNQKNLNPLQHPPGTTLQTVQLSKKKKCLSKWQGAVKSRPFSLSKRWDIFAQLLERNILFRYKHY